MLAFFVTPLLPRAFSSLFPRIFLILLLLESLAIAQIPSEPPLFTQPPFAEAKDRITGFVDDEQRVTLPGNRHPLANAQYDAGAVSPDFRMDRMLITLLPDAAQENALIQLIDDQHDPESRY